MNRQQQRIDDTLRAHGWIVVDSGPSDNRSHLNMSHISTHKEKLMTDKQWEEALNWDGTNLKPAPTTEQLARQLAEHVKALEVSSPEMTATAERILATTTPPTMADVEWDDEKHYLAGATTSNGGSVVMLWHDDIDTDHIITDHAEWQRDRLTPNGKRYELREIGEPEQPEHPATLETLEDYENAPAGTVVAEPGRPALTKTHGGEWHRYGGWFTSDEMAHTERQVLRWGEGGDTSEPTVSSNENVGADQQEHPATLVTEADYENAPEGTIVARGDYAPYVKRGPNAWTTEYSSLAYDEDMAHAPRKVLRWGWGK